MSNTTSAASKEPRIFLTDLDKIKALILGKNKKVYEQFVTLVGEKIDNVYGAIESGHIGVLLHNNFSVLLEPSRSEISPDSLLFHIVEKGSDGKATSTGIMFLIDFQANQVTDQSQGLVKVH